MDRIDKNINEWEKTIYNIYLNQIEYKNYISDILLSDITSSNKIDKYDKKLQKIGYNKIKYNISDTESLFELLNKVTDINNTIFEYSEIIFKEEYLKQIKSTMSETYYGSILKVKNNIIKDYSKIYSITQKVIDTIVENINNDIVSNTDIEDFINICTKNINKNTIYLYNKYINIYKQILKEDDLIKLNNFIQNLYEFILGYNNEKLNVNTFSKHPITLMGITFNLNTKNDFFIKENELSKNNIIINNYIINMRDFVIYNIDKLLNGKYNMIKKNQSIDRDIVEYAKTIYFEPIISPNKTISGSITNNVSKNDSEIVNVYESLDNGNTFRELKNKYIKNINIPFIDKGPKPRIYLYNKNIFELIKNNPNINLNNKIEKKGSLYIELDKDFIKNNTLESMYKHISSQHTKNDLGPETDEKRLYNIYKSNFYLSEIRKGGGNKIPNEDFSVLQLFR